MYHYLYRKIFSDGKKVPKGVTLIISPLALSLNPAIWKDPETFNPDRFELDNLTGLHPFAYLPFSAGPRNCIGQKFAMYEIKSTVSKVLRHFEIALEPNFKPIIIPVIVMKSSNGIRLRLKARKY